MGADYHRPQAAGQPPAPAEGISRFSHRERGGAWSSAIRGHPWRPHLVLHRRRSQDRLDRRCRCRPPEGDRVTAPAAPRQPGQAIRHADRVVGEAAWVTDDPRREREPRAVSASTASSPSNDHSVPGTTTLTIYAGSRRGAAGGPVPRRGSVRTLRPRRQHPRWRTLRRGRTRRGPRRYRDHSNQRHPVGPRRLREQTRDVRPGVGVCCRHAELGGDEDQLATPGSTLPCATSTSGSATVRSDLNSRPMRAANLTDAIPRRQPQSKLAVMLSHTHAYGVDRTPREGSATGGGRIGESLHAVADAPSVLEPVVETCGDPPEEHRRERPEGRWHVVPVSRHAEHDEHEGEDTDPRERSPRSPGSLPSPTTAPSLRAPRAHR